MKIYKFMNNVIALPLMLILLAGMALSQAKGQTAESSRKMKSIRVRIDGFMKSKSGAV